MMIFIKLLTSLPVLMIAFYFSTLLGYMLIIGRLFIQKTDYISGFLMIIVAIGLYYFNNHEFLLSLIPDINSVIIKSYAITVMIAGVFLIIVEIISQKVAYTTHSLLNRLFNTLEKSNREGVTKGQYQAKMYKEDLKYTRLVTCPNCGAETYVTKKVSKCPYCRSSIG